MFLYSPSYLNVVLRFPVAHTGFSASLAPLAQFCIKLLAGFTSDKVRSFFFGNYLEFFFRFSFNIVNRAREKLKFSISE